MESQAVERNSSPESGRLSFETIRSLFNKFLLQAGSPRNFASPIGDAKEDPKPLIAVHENLHYEIQIGTGTHIETLQTNGIIELMIPESPGKLSEDGTDTPTSEKKPVGYLGLSNYEATSWIDKLRGNSQPVRIPIRSPSVSKDSTGILKFKYNLNLEKSKLMALPVFLKAEIIDDEEIGSSVLETGISFHNKLRLVLKISSDVARLSRFDLEHILNELERCINFLQKRVDVLKKQVDELKTQEGKEKAKAAGQEITLGEAEKALKESEEKFRIYKCLIEYYEKEHSQESIWSDPQEMLWEILRELIKKWQDHNLQELSPALMKLIESLEHKVKLDYIEVKAPYVRHSVRTFIRMGKDESKQAAWFYTPRWKWKPLTWSYNPQRQCLELRDQVLMWNPDTNLYETELYLDLDPPTEEGPELQGSLVLHIDEALSGLKVEWLDNKITKDNEERDEQFEIDSKTWLRLDFIIPIDEIFRERSFRPRRQLHLEGVVPQPHHVNNIRNILSNHGLTILDGGGEPFREIEEMSHRGEKHYRGSIIALRQGAYEDIIRIEVKGRKRKGRRTIYYNDKHEQLAEAVDVGALDITLAASMKRPSEEVNRFLNLIQLDLERYFVTVAEVGRQEAPNAD
jgi:hypothetical protein